MKQNKMNPIIASVGLALILTGVVMFVFATSRIKSERHTNPASEVMAVNPALGQLKSIERDEAQFSIMRSAAFDLGVTVGCITLLDEQAKGRTSISIDEISRLSLERVRREVPGQSFEKLTVESVEARVSR